jgi:hypothetical protein
MKVMINAVMVVFRFIRLGSAGLFCTVLAMCVRGAGFQNERYSAVRAVIIALSYKKSGL